MNLEQFTRIVFDEARRWSNETPSQPVKMHYDSQTRFALSRGPIGAVLTQNGDSVDVEVGTLDHRTPYKTVPLTGRDAEAIGQEIGAKMRA